MSRYYYPYGVFEVDTIPAQPQIAHCHGFFVPIGLRGKGHAHTLKQRQVECLHEQFFDYATSTVDASNAAQKKVLTKAGFHRLDVFTNSKTGGKTEIWGRQISREQT